MQVGDAARRGLSRRPPGLSLRPGSAAPALPAGRRRAGEGFTGCRLQEPPCLGRQRLKQLSKGGTAASGRRVRGLRREGQRRRRAPSTGSGTHTPSVARGAWAPEAWRAGWAALGRPASLGAALCPLLLPPPANGLESPAESEARKISVGDSQLLTLMTPHEMRRAGWIPMSSWCHFGGPLPLGTKTSGKLHTPSPILPDW